MSKRISILIGVSVYESERISNLKTPANDVYRFSKLLLDGEVGGFDLCETSINGSREEILRNISETVSMCGVADTLILYYSGHGIVLPDLKLYLAASDTDLEHLFATGISVTEILSELERCRAKRQLLIFDACQSGAFHLQAPTGFGHSLQSHFESVENSNDGVGRFIVCASDEDSPAIASASASDDALSTLTEAICYGLDTGDADIDADGFVSTNDLAQYCDRAVERPRPYTWSYKTSGKSLIARSRKFKGFDYRSLSRLEDDLIAGLANNNVSVRLGCISELSKIAQQSGEVASSARVALSHLASSNHSQISKAASAALDATLQMYAVPIAPSRLYSEGTPSASVEPSHNLKIDFRFVPEGPFLMGGDTHQKYTKRDQLPLHLVETDAYWISKYPITQQQFLRFVKEYNYTPTSEIKTANRVSFNVKDNRYKSTGRNWRNPFSKPNNYEVFRDHPAVFMSFWDALMFCRWVSARVGLPVTLPSEAEWEKAARGADDRVWPWGKEPPSNHHANFGHRTKSTTPVGTYSEYGASPYGCFDMSGNVWEWTTGLYRSYPYSSERHPEDLEINAKRVLRGGSWNVGTNRTTVSFRKVWASDRCCDGHGFRPIIRMPKEPVERHLNQKV